MGIFACINEFFISHSKNDWIIHVTKNLCHRIHFRFCTKISVWRVPTRFQIFFSRHWFLLWRYIQFSAHFSKLCQCAYLVTLSDFQFGAKFILAVARRSTCFPFQKLCLFLTNTSDETTDKTNFVFESGSCTNNSFDIKNTLFGAVYIYWIYTFYSVAIWHVHCLDRSWCFILVLYAKFFVRLYAL